MNAKPSILRTRLALTIGGIATGVLIFLPLTWLLARLIWLWFFFGLFFFLLAPLLAAAPVFRVLRSMRPMSTPHVVSVCAVIACAAWLTSIVWEYRYVAATAGDIPSYSDARAALLKAGRSPDEMYARAAAALRHRLDADFPPGGILGYVRWGFSGGQMDLTVNDLNLPGNPSFSDHASIRPMVLNRLFGSRHLAEFMNRWGWVIRAAAALGLLFLGLWWQLSDLRSPVPHSNLIDPDEADEIERAELKDAGEPGFAFFEHTADVGLEARGRKWPGLLEQAALGLMSAIGRLAPDRSDRGEKVTIKLKAPHREELLHDWLSELLFYFEAREQMVDGIKIRDATDTHLIADVTLRRIDRHKSVFHREVKAVTYHGIEITPIKRGLSARVILDI